MAPHYALRNPPTGKQLPRQQTLWHFFVSQRLTRRYQFECQISSPFSGARRFAVGLRLSTIHRADCLPFLKRLLVLFLVSLDAVKNCLRGLLLTPRVLEDFFIVLVRKICRFHEHVRHGGAYEDIESRLFDAVIFDVEMFAHFLLEDVCELLAV